MRGQLRNQLQHAMRERVESANMEQMVSMFAGGALIGLALTRGLFSGTALAALGTGLVCHALYGRSLSGAQEEMGARVRSSVPSPEIEADVVTESSWESFPASDPPSAY